MTGGTRIAIVGGSIAGAAAADAARSAGYAGTIDLYDAQPHLPYDRPPLSKGILSGEQEVESIALKAEEQWRELGIHLLLGQEVLRIDPEHRAVTTASDARTYDGIILAPGTRPRRAPFPVSPTVRSHVLRTTDDALALRQAMQTGQRVVIIGGGFIGLEVAGAVTALGRHCTVVEAAELPLARAVGGAVATFVVDRHRAAGCDFRTGVQVTRVDDAADGHAVVHLSDGSRLDADTVILSIGVEPATTFLDDSGLEIEDGIVTDEYCRTAAPRVYACGDAARGYSLLYDRHLRVEHWTTAREQGAHAAENLVAELDGREPSPFRHVPYVWSDQLGMKIQSAGRLFDDATQTVEHADDTSITTTFHSGGELAGGAAVNRVRDVMRVRRELLQKLTPPRPENGA